MRQSAGIGRPERARPKGYKMWLLLDAVIAVIFVFFAVSGTKRGLIKSVCGVFITVVAVLIAINFHASVAEFFRTTVVYRQLTDNLNEKVEEYVANSLDSEKLGTLLDDAPTGITALLKGFGTDTDAVKEKYESLVQSGETQIAAKLSDYIVEPAAETLSNALAMLAVFVAAILLLNLAVFLLDLVFKLPVLHFANKFGGFLFGLAAGLLAVFVFCTVVNIALPYLPGAGISIDKDSASNAILFAKLSEINPLSFLYR